MVQVVQRKGRQLLLLLASQQLAMLDAWAPCPPRHAQAAWVIQWSRVLHSRRALAALCCHVSATAVTPATAACTLQQLLSANTAARCC